MVVINAISNIHFNAQRVPQKMIECPFSSNGLLFYSMRIANDEN